MDFATVSLKASNFKCLGETFEGFERIKPVNIIIGRNNSGKSTLIELVAKAVRNSPIAGLGHLGQAPDFRLSFPLTGPMFESLSNDPIEIRSPDRGVIWRPNPKKWATSRLRSKQSHWSLAASQDLKFITADDVEHAEQDEIKYVLGHIGRTLERTVKNPFMVHSFCRVASERDAVPEKPSGSLEVLPNGTGLTNAVAQYIHSDKLDRDVIEVILLRELNSIFRPDADFRRIMVQQSESGYEEIFLEEDGKGRIRLSQTGSGLKTVLLVLANLILVPRQGGGNRPLSEFFFAFEELENNLHPAIQRRLFSYLRRRAVEEKSHMFITTHSNVVIDLFAQDDQAQILHVTHDGKCAHVTTVETSAHGSKVLDDLDVRASDLLQTNAVVWVEGPSDIIYFNAWIRLWSYGKLIEGVHYQCVPYGGSVNAHLTFERDEDIQDMIDALKINRHAILLIDSDRTKLKAPLKKHAERLVDEVQRVEGYAWVTAGKEVENYIPVPILEQLVPAAPKRWPTAVSNVIAFLAKQRGVKKVRKTDVADRVASLLTREMLETTSDFAERLNAVTSKIKEWNRLQ